MDPYKVAMSKLVLAISHLEAVSSNIVALINLDSSITSLPDPPDSEIKLVFKDGVAVLDETVSYLYEVNSFFSKLETAKNDSGLTADPMEQILADPVRQMRLETTVRTEPKEVKIGEIKTNESDCMTPNEIFEYIRNNDVKLSVPENYNFINFKSPTGMFTEKLKISLKKRKHYIIQRLIVDETIALIMQYPPLLKSYYMNNKDDYFKDYKIFLPITNLAIGNWYILKTLLDVVITRPKYLGDPLSLTTGGILEAFRVHEGFHVLVYQSQYCIDTPHCGDGTVSDDIVTRFKFNLKFLEKSCRLLSDNRKGMRREKRNSSHSKKYCKPQEIVKFFPYISKHCIYTNINRKPVKEGFMDCLVRVGKRWKVNIKKFGEWLDSEYS